MAILRCFLLIFIVVLGSCATQKRCQKRFPPQIVTKDSIVFKTVEIEVPVYIHIPGDTVTKVDTVYIDKTTGLITSNKLFSETEYAHAWAQVINSKLFMELIQKDTAIERLIRESIQVKEVYKTKTKIIKEPYVKWYHTASMWIAIPVVLLILAYLIYKAVRLYLKIQSGGVI